MTPDFMTPLLASAPADGGLLPRGGLFLAEGGLMDMWTRFNFGGIGASKFARDADHLFFWIFLISAFFFVLLMGMTAWFSFKYRWKPGAVPQRSASHNTYLELAWSVIPTMLLVWMFFKGFWGYADGVISPAQGLTIDVIGKQWSWNAVYPNGAVSSESTRARSLNNPGSENGVQDTPIFYVPEATPVTLRLSSEDVIHSFWVPDMRTKFDAFPNRYTSVWFEGERITGDKTLPPDKKGNPTLGKDGKPVPYTDHWVFCAEYCGSNHSEMMAIIRVVPRDYFKHWMEDAATPKGTLVERGQAYYKIKGCNACHSIDGTKAIGPTWKNLYGYEVNFTDGTGMTAAERTGATFAEYFKTSVFNPGAKIVQGYPNQMQSYLGRLSDEEMRCLIAYMSSPLLTDRPAPQSVDDVPENQKK